MSRRNGKHNHQRQDLQQAADKIHGRPLGAEDFVRDEAVRGRASQPGNRFESQQAARGDARVTLGFLQIQHAPVVHGVAGHSHERAGERQHPDRGVLEDGKLHLPRGFWLLRAVRGFGQVIVLPIRHGGQAHGLGAVLHDQIQRDGEHHADDSGSYKTGPPAKPGHHRGQHRKRQPFAQRVGRAPDAVVCSALPVAEPLRHGHHARGSAEPLKPPVQGP